MTVASALSSLVLSLSLLLLQTAGGYCAAADAGATTIDTSTDTTQYPNAYERRYHKAWQLVKENFLYPDRLRYWDAWEHRYDGQLRTSGQADRAISALLDSLHDDYTYLRDAERTAAARTGSRSSVYARLLPSGIGYIKIRTLGSASVPEQTRKALAKLQYASRYIIDLRDNHGGLIENAYALYGMLTGPSEFGTFVGRDAGSDYHETLTFKDGELELNRDGAITKCDRESDRTAGKPLVILVNSDTRSAAEMLAAALQDNGRARLVGTKTYGKGVVQDVWDLRDGASVKITSAQFIRPSGMIIHGIGLTPDVPADQSHLSDTGLAVASRLLENQRLAGINKPRSDLQAYHSVFLPYGGGSEHPEFDNYTSLPF